MNSGNIKVILVIAERFTLLLKSWEDIRITEEYPDITQLRQNATTTKCIYDKMPRN